MLAFISPPVSSTETKHCSSRPIQALQFLSLQSACEVNLVNPAEQASSWLALHLACTGKTPEPFSGRPARLAVRTEKTTMMLETVNEPVLKPAAEAAPPPLALMQML